jgi:excisionase family DNA binding protein
MSVELAKIDAEKPTEEASAQASEALSALVEFLRAHPTPSRRLRVCSDEGTEETTIVVPSIALQLFTDVLAQMAEGNAVTVAPVHAEITTQQAANYLNVSRPYVIKLLDERRLPYRMVGNRRRILFSDLMQFKREDNRNRKEILDGLAAEAQELNLGY